jgi:hypothetical protein
VAYEKGVSQSPLELLEQLKSFCEKNGWQTNLYGEDSKNNDEGKRLHLQKEKQYINLRVGANSAKWSLALQGATGFAADKECFQQPGYVQDIVGEGRIVGIYYGEKTLAASYHFFTAKDTVYGVIENPTGKFQYFAWGMLNKIGNYQGGQFFSASISQYPLHHNSAGGYNPAFADSDLPSSYVRLDVDEEQEKWCAITYFISDDGYSHQGLTSRRIKSALVTKTAKANGIYHYLPFFAYDYSLSSLAGSTVLLPIYLSVERGQALTKPTSSKPKITDYVNSDIYSLIGTIPNVYMLNITNLNPGSGYAVGTNQYLVFPVNYYKGNKEFGNIGFAIQYSE